MDEDMEAVEIVFAQRLASGEPTTRKRALKLLINHIKEKSAKDAFTSQSMDRLCKGLHYALWMQDKMILQEELADNICDLTFHFQKEEQIMEFAQSLVLTLSKEWPFIDRWRMDKFLMLIRRLIRVIFVRLANQHWDSALCEQYLELFRKTLISPHSRICESLKFHCASLWLDELDNAAREKALNPQQCLEFLSPYIQLLKEDISDTFFQSICSDIFDTILHDFSEQMTQDGEESSDSEAEIKPQKKIESNSDGLQFEYQRLAEMLFESGKQQKVPARRRKRLYALCNKFENVAKGVDPFPPDELTKKMKKFK